MADYEIGRGKPPRQYSYKKGVFRQSSRQAQGRRSLPRALPNEWFHSRPRLRSCVAAIVSLSKDPVFWCWLLPS